MTCFSCQHSSAATTGARFVPVLVCGLGLPCPVPMSACPEAIYEPGTDERERECLQNAQEGA